MAEVNVPALAAIAPVAPRPPASQGASQPAGQTEQPSFSQVLKSRSQAQQAQKSEAGKVPTKTASAKDAKGSAAQDGQAREASQSTDTTNAATEVASAATQAIDPAVLLGIASLNAAHSATAPEASKSTDDTPATTDEGARNDQPLFATSTAALAAQAARLAGNNQDNSKPATEAQTSLTTDSRQLASQAATEASGKTETSILATDTTTTKLADTAGSDKSTSFATELANASQNLNVGAGSQTTHGVLANGQNARTNALPQHEIATPVASQGWADEVGQKVSWIANRDSGRAELILTPPQLGRVEVSISMSGDQASATFITASPAAREALQDAMPRLREVLAQSGIQLGQANVNAGFSGQTQPDNSGKPSSSNRFSAQSDAGIGNIDALAGSARSSWSRQGSGMIDTFA